MCSGCIEKEVVKILKVDVEKPELGKPNFDSERILKPLREKFNEEIKIPLVILQKLPYTLRRCKNSIYVILVKNENYWEVGDILCEKPEEILGVGIDLGSTTVAFYIYDFVEKKLIKSFSILNPQIKIGEDILTRLHFAKKQENLEYIKNITIEAINEELQKIGSEKIYYLSFCGNTAMTHFFLGLPVNYLFIEPYVPCVKWIGILDSKELNLRTHPLSKIFIFPIAGTYFGGDLIAGLFFSEIYKKEELNFFIDIGTNAEVVLGNKEFLLACAGAAGPALEGAIFECASQAKEGAIERIRIKNNKIEYSTIGEMPPVSICGSGVIDLIAELFLNGLINSNGKFQIDKFPERFRKIGDEYVFIVAEENETAFKKPIYIKQSEIKSFLRSKGAMFTILSLVCEKVGISFDEVSKFYIAGSFGNHVDINSAVTLGMFPEQALQKSVALGNAAGKGVLKFLTYANLEEIKQIVEMITYIELNIDSRFMELLTGAIFIPHVNLELFPQVMRKLKGLKNV